MENIKEKYEQLSILDKNINRLETIKRNLFFENLDEKDVLGEIDLPLVANSNTTDYEKLKAEKKELDVQIKYYQKLVENPQCLAPTVIVELKKEGMSDEQIKQELDDRIKKLIEEIKVKIQKLQERMTTIENDSKTYLRFRECENCNYSRISNSEIVSNLKSIDEELKKLLQERKRLLKSIKLTENQNKKLKFGLASKIDKND